nr:hypothetical protein [Tanacetum cinerariifolium]
MKILQLGVFVCDPPFHTLTNELSLFCHLGLGKREHVGSVSVMGRAWVRMRCRRCMAKRFDRSCSLLMSSTRLSLLGDKGGEFTLSSLDVLQGFSFFLQIGLTLILATLDGLDVGLLGDVIGKDGCDDDG